jgi:2-keto-3-deoxy-galactonokinase
MTSAQGAGYLSGLLIGYEIREALPRFAPAAVPGIGAPGTGVAGSGVAGPEGAIVVVGAHALVPLYQAALTRAGANVVPLDGDAAVVAGLLLASRML